MVRWMLILLIAGIATAFAVGVRIHPTAIPAYFQDTSHKIFAHIEFTSGTQMTAELIEETDSQIVLQIEGGQIGFGRNEIRSLKKLSDEDLASGLYEGLNVTPKREPLISFDKERGLLNFKLSSSHQRADADQVARYKEQKRLSDYYDRAEKKHAQTVGNWKKKTDKQTRRVQAQADLGYKV